MKVIYENSNLRRIKEQDYFPSKTYVKSIYIKALDIKDGLLVYNSLTSEFILTTKDEFDNPTPSDKKWLCNHWFYFEESLDPKSVAHIVRNFIAEKPKAGSNFVVLTTSVCNARCYYCFESEFRQFPMSDKIALDTAKYLVQNAKNNQVRITWFGGEPLCNPKAMKIITDHLIKCNVNYRTSMISNGYLFDKFSMEEIKEQWKMNMVQITLDGTKEIYQQSKNYKNEDPNAYERVLNNIEYLLKNDITVTIRLNVSLNNGEDLIALIHELYDRFSKYEKFKIYPNELFIGAGNPPLELTEVESEQLFQSVIKIYDLLSGLNILSRGIDIINYASNHCMADTGTCKVITPDGLLSPCEHYVDDSHSCGNIYDGVQNYDELLTWKEFMKTLPECDSCYYYPKCMKIKRCPTDNICKEPQRKLMDFRVELEMLKIYNNWKLQQ